MKILVDRQLLKLQVHFIVIQLMSPVQIIAILIMIQAIHIRVIVLRAVMTVDLHQALVGIDMEVSLHPEQLFELFYKNIRDDMQPPFIWKHSREAQYHFWRERFMNAYYGIKEPYSLRSWAEAPQMWLAGYRENSED